MSPCGVLASAAFDNLENDSNICPGTPVIPPSSSTITICISSPEPDLSDTNFDVPGAPPSTAS